MTRTFLLLFTSFLFSFLLRAEEANNVEVLTHLSLFKDSKHYSHPLVCGDGRDFLKGVEFIYSDSKQNIIHIVFPAAIELPNKYAIKIYLKGYHQGIQKIDSYNIKSIPKDYKYFVVTSWKQSKSNPNR